jgi:hypothetical protein
MVEYNYCTLFNYNYLSRGLLLYKSLCITHSDFCLYIFAFDSKTKEFLLNKKLSKAIIIGLDEFEDESLLDIKPTRTFVEYCWTCTPSIIKYSIEKYSLSSCTYLDADLYFFSSPKPIFNEISFKSVGITSHNYSSDYDKSKSSGKFCVQFVYIKNDNDGIKAITWWRNECINWCYARVEEGRFGDQMYLDSFSSLFENVHEIENPGSGIAPWNIQKYTFSKNGDILVGTINPSINFTIIFYHFHYLRINFQDKTIDLRKYRYSKDVIDLFYIPYIKDLLIYENEINQTDYQIDNFKLITSNLLSLKFRSFARKLFEIKFIRNVSEKIMPRTLR